MAQRAAVSRLVLASSVLGFAYVGVVSCGGSDDTKHVRDEAGGEGGESTGGNSNSGGSKATGAGNGGKATGGTAGQANGGSAGSGGNAGTTPTELGGAGQGPTATAGAGGEVAASGGQGGAGESGAPSDSGAAGMLGAAGAGGAGDTCQLTPVMSRITMAFDAANAERVTNLQWLDNSDTTIANIAASGGPQTCNDPSEFFGESYGAPEGTTPWVVVAGHRSTATTCGSDITITSTPNDCANQAQIPVTTEYHFYGGAKASEMRVTRSIGFDQNSPAYTGTGVRAWEPRVPLGTFGTVIYPNAAETAITSTPAGNCPGDCLIPVGATWSGRWFADVAANGLALIVLRDASMTAPVDLTINYDGYSNATIASFVVLQPQGGFKAPFTEIQYVCFADLVSWPQTDRDAAKLPAFCGP